MPYTIEFKKSAFKELEKLPVLIQQNITSNIAGLALNPRPNGCKKLKGRDNHWRIRNAEIIKAHFRLNYFFVRLGIF